ncbi:MAG: PAS domain-containing protein [Verrucomicrobiota bacterium]
MNSDSHSQTSQTREELLIQLEALRQELALTRLRQESLESVSPSRVVEQLMLLAEASKALFGSPNLEQVLPGILDLSRHMISADGYAVWRVVSGSGWKAVCHSGISRKYLEAAAAASTASLAVPRHPVMIEDADLEARFEVSRELRQAEGIQSMLMLPLPVHGELCGLLTFYYRQAHRFNAVEVQLATALTNLTGAAIASAELYERETHLRSAAETAVRALHDSETRFRVAAECASDLIYEWDLRRGTVAWFGDIDLALGYSPGGFPRTRTGWEQQLHAEDIGMVQSAVQQHFETGQAFLQEYRIRHRNGRFRYWIDRGKILRDAHGNPCVWIGVTSDITDQKKHEQEKELLVAQAIGQRQRLVDLVRSVPGVVWEAWGEPDSVAQRINFVSEYVERMLGYTVEEWLATPNFWLTIVHPEDRERAGRVAAESFAAACDHRNVFRWVRKDGRWIWVEAHATVIRDKGGRPIGMRGVTLDISERKKAEEAISQLNEELEQRVRMRTAELLETNEQMEAFCYTVSHDLRAPLRAMQGFTKALAEDYAECLDETGRDYARRVGAAVTRMDCLINDLLEYSRLSRMALPINPIDLNPVLEAVLGDLQHEIERRHAEVRTAHSLPIVLGHPVVLKQVFYNLISNALKFVPPEIAPRVLISSESGAERVRILVRDNGIGIAAQHQHRIFGVFERLHPKENFPGTGIGLAIVRKGVERLDGSCGVTSSPGEGSQFWVELKPASPPSGALPSV